MMTYLLLLKKNSKFVRIGEIKLATAPRFLADNEPWKTSSDSKLLPFNLDKTLRARHDTI